MYLRGFETIIEKGLSSMWRRRSSMVPWRWFYIKIENEILRKKYTKTILQTFHTNFTQKGGIVFSFLLLLLNAICLKKRFYSQANFWIKNWFFSIEFQ